MDDLRKILEGMLTPARLERIATALEARLGALRVVTENLRNTHNMNAVLRTCEAFGVQHLHVVEGEKDFSINRKITKGSHKWIDLHRHLSIGDCARELKAEGFSLYAAMLGRGAVPLDEIPLEKPVAIILGNERTGVSEEAVSYCDGFYTIPMHGFVQSFNISVAAAISIYSLSSRMRKERPDHGALSPEERARVLGVWLPKTAPYAKKIAKVLAEANPSR
jgi:tRNA (guanosine-2'-O-)-methyltransferase